MRSTLSPDFFVSLMKFLSITGQFLAPPDQQLLNGLSVPTQVVTLTQVVTGDNLGLTQVVTFCPK